MPEDLNKLVKILSDGMVANLSQTDEDVAQLDKEDFNRSLHVEPLEPLEHKRENPSPGKSPFRDRKGLKPSPFRRGT